MVMEARRLNRNDWLESALTSCRSGIDKIKVAPLAAGMGVTTGSFYWHFKNRDELLNALLEFWEREMTDRPIEGGRRFEGSPADRIYLIMETVMTRGLARYDLAIRHWAQSDANAKQVFERAMQKRFSFATWMFSEAGFSPQQAETRGRMMVIYMMGEFTLDPESAARRKDLLKLKHGILTSPES